MFSELVFTRCRQGIDILKSGRSITSDGFKVFSCTSSLMEEGGDIDLPLLFSAAQGKQPYNDPSFMDDAYLYYVPDRGDSFMVNFHPIPFDPTATGDYSHRPGNFVNHLLVGNYSSFYPFELFRNSSVWNAKARGEAYYYANAPTDLPARSDITAIEGKINLEEVRSFISDARSDALTAAVAFLIQQYEMPPDERKFLVIRDESTEKIELWITAIELAFSPRMAAAIPFATRFDKFITTNRYTVNQMGMYQTQINLQDKNQKLRYRAMIVGVDEHDKSNAATARPLANASFVLLDGKEKRATFEVDASKNYYQGITRFDDEHQIFCRQFLQMIDISAPCSDIYQLYEIYKETANSLPNAVTMGKILTLLSKYRLFVSPTLIDLYNRIKAALPRFLQENLYSALQIIKWLQAASRTVGDFGATQELTDIVYRAFAEHVYGKSDAERTFEFWNNIKGSEFANSVAGYFVNASTIQSNAVYFQGLKPSDSITFVLIYLECVALLGTMPPQDFKAIVSQGLQICAHARDTESARKILNALSQTRTVAPKDMLFSIAKDADKEFADFIVKFLMEADMSIVASDASTIAFLRRLGADHMEHLFGAVLKCRALALTNALEVEQFTKTVLRLQQLNSDDLSEILVLVDQKLNLADRNSMNTALIIQTEKPGNIACVRSAHLYALYVLSDKYKRADFMNIYNELIWQGFPSETNMDYIYTLTEVLFKAKMSPEELSYIVQLFARAPVYISELVRAILNTTSSKQIRKWNVLVHTAAKTNDPAITDAIIKGCVSLKQGEKALDQLTNILSTRERRDYFRQIALNVKEVIRAQRTQSGLGRLFGKFTGDDDTPRRRGR